MRTSLRTTIRTLIIGAALGGGMTCAPLTYAAELDESVSFDIHPQPLESALLELSKQSSYQIVFTPGVVPNLRAPAISGTMQIRDALLRLLDGTRLDYRLVGKRTITVGPGEAERTREGFSTTQRTAPSTFRAVRYAQAATAMVDDAATASANHRETLENTARSLVELEEVVVTGSRIKRSQEEVSASVVTFEREEIDRMGAGTVNDVLRYLPQATFVNDEAGQNSYMGRTSINLRGLGAGMTVVLLNGRRIPASSITGGSFVDLGTIPLGMVERMEILAEGASAVYGSDALGGVMNIILRKEVSGLELQGRYSHIADADERSVSAGYGGSIGKLSGTIFVDAYERDAYFQSQRRRTSLADATHLGGRSYETTWGAHPGNVYSLDGEPLPGLTSTFAGIPDGDGIGLTPADFLATDGILNVARHSGGSLQPHSERRSVTSTLEYEFNASLEAFAEASWMNQETSVVSGTNILAAGSIGFYTIAADNPYNPFGVPVGIDYNFTESAPMTNQQETSNTRVLLGLRGDLASGWDWEVAGSLFRDDGEVRQLNQLDPERVRAALNATDPAQALNMFSSGPSGSAELLNSLISHGRDWTRAEGRQRQVDGFIRGPVFGGAAQLLMGAEYREEELAYVSSSSYLSEPERIGGERDVQSFYSELLVPLIKREMGLWVDDLVLSAAGRYDRYSDFGDTFNPQLSLTLRPLPSVQFRAAWSSSFRAPTMSSLYGPRTKESVVGADPARGEDAAYTYISGGNPKLEAETGDSISIGLQLTPTLLPGLMININYWKLNLEDLIGGVNVLAHESRLPSRVIRAAPTAEDIAAGLPGRLLQVDNSVVNVGVLKTNGVDLKLSYSLRTPLGVFTPSLAATYVDSYERSSFKGDPLEDVVGLGAGLGYGSGTIVPWKGNVGVSWQRNGAQLALTGRYTDSYLDSGLFGSGRGTRNVEDQFLIDLTGGYEFTSLGLRLTGGAVNLFDKEPPFSNIASSYGYDPSQGDIRGRMLFLQINQTF